MAEQLLSPETIERLRQLLDAPGPTDAEVVEQLQRIINDLFDTCIEYEAGLSYLFQRYTLQDGDPDWLGQLAERFNTVDDVDAAMDDYYSTIDSPK